PENDLIMDPSGNLYGTSGASVFELSPSEGGWTAQWIWDGGTASGVTMDAAGNIFGTTMYPNSVYELTPNGQGGWNGNTIYTFSNATKDGETPFGTLVLDNAGNLYGTAYGGGAHGDGAVYKLTLVTTGKKKGTWTEKLLYSFKGGTKDGSNPWAGIMFDASGNIYGTTRLSGKYNYQGGTVYELVADDGKYKEKILWSFNNTDGGEPYDSLLLDGGNLYGTTSQGGSNGDGVVFEVTP